MKNLKENKFQEVENVEKLEENDKSEQIVLKSENNEYVFLESDIIGKGTFAKVYKGKALRENNVVAIKHIEKL